MLYNKVKPSFEGGGTMNIYYEEDRELADEVVINPSNSNRN